MDNKKKKSNYFSEDELLKEYWKENSREFMITYQ